MAADDRALVVGISHYPGIRDLKGPTNDVDSFVAWLTDPQKGNVPAVNIVRIVSDAALPNRPILADVTKFFLDLMTEQAEKATRRLGDRVYLFLSGHGFAASVLSQAALCMADSVAKITSYPHLGGQVFADDLGNRGMFDEVFLWMDCCRQMIPGLPINLPHWAPADPKIPPRRFFWGFATTTGELAAEAQMLVGNERRYHGVFTALLLEALERCKTRLGGQVCASDVANYIFNRMQDVLGPTAPRPQFQTDPVHDMVLFIRETELNSVEFQADGVAVGRLRISTGQNEDALPEPVPILSDRAKTAIEAGLYKATIVGTSRSQVFEIPGDTLVRIPL